MQLSYQIPAHHVSYSIKPIFLLHFIVSSSLLILVNNDSITFSHTWIACFSIQHDTGRKQPATNWTRIILKKLKFSILLGLEHKWAFYDHDNQLMRISHYRHVTTSVHFINLQSSLFYSKIKVKFWHHSWPIADTQ